ncbi:MAG: protein kinase [Gemmatimonadota bacterium]
MGEGESIIRLNAALEGRYRIENKLGEGGMAMVYLANDLRHERKVALKVLKPELAAVVGAERFLAEIKTTANLQHPHILPLFDSGEADGFLFYVMPHVEGDSLRTRLDREKQLPVSEAVDIASKVAHALDYAHRHGVVHRDIKPANVLLHDGEPVVADFGIALALTREGGRLTETGLSLGTPEYMSPEQGSGEREIGPRADIYALGCVLYELLTGRPPHTGASSQAIMAKVLTQPPAPVEEDRTTVPRHVSRAVSRALQPLPADRFSTAGDFAAALAPGVGEAEGWAGEPPAWLTDWRTLVTLGALAVAVGAVGIMGTHAPSASTSGVVRFTVSLPDDRRVLTTQPLSLALSRDGSLLVYVGADGDSNDARQRLYVRRIDRLEPEPLAGTEGASRPFLSPDGAWVGFFVGTALKKVSLSGGNPITLAGAVRTFAGRAVWLDDGTIIYPVTLGRLDQVSEAGGRPRTVLDDSTVAVLGLGALPEARGVMFFQCPVLACPINADLVGLELPGGGRTTLVESGMPFDPLAPAKPMYATSGHLLYGRTDGTLMAAPLDLESLSVEATPVPVLEGMLDPGMVALSDNGTLVYLAGSVGGSRRLVLVDRDGSPTPLPGPARVYGFPRFDPEARRLVTEIHDETGGHVWLDDLTSNTLSPITAGGHEPGAVWSPDGTRVAYVSLREGGAGLFVASVDREAAERRIHPVDVVGSEVGVTAWSPDGRWILFTQVDAHDSQGIFVIAADGTEDAYPLLATPAEESNGQLSPNGEWLVYQSDESGTTEVYVTAFPDPGGRWAVSSEGGYAPVWRGDEIFYRRFDGLYVATVAPGERPPVQQRRRLFDDTRFRGVGATFDVTPDGQQLLMVETLEQAAEMVVTLNWFEELRELTAGTR